MGERKSLGILLAILSGVGIVFGTLMPWGRFEVEYGMMDGGYGGGYGPGMPSPEGYMVNVTGLSASGLLVLLGTAAAVLAVLVWTGTDRRRGGGLIGLGALFSALGAGAWLATVEEASPFGSFEMGETAVFSPRFGVWIALTASAVGLVAAFLLMVAEPSVAAVEVPSASQLPDPGA